MNFTLAATCARHEARAIPRPPSVGMQSRPPAYAGDPGYRHAPAGLRASALRISGTRSSRRGNVKPLTPSLRAAPGVAAFRASRFKSGPWRKLTAPGRPYTPGRTGERIGDVGATRSRRRALRGNDEQVK